MLNVVEEVPLLVSGFVNCAINVVVMSFPNKAERQKCWDSRDRYWECLDINKDENEHCLKLRQLYESSCSSQWVKHFDRKRNYLKFKDRIEKEGYEPLRK
uniref:Uncharacterized protein n=1 Tax=Timema poppense TaxID=170557 RepID=A0A7R9CJ56_TIMPO|nr:unnamed protein product [Timema poppensis]